MKSKASIGLAILVGTFGLVVSSEPAAYGESFVMTPKG